MDDGELDAEITLSKETVKETKDIVWSAMRQKNERKVQEKGAQDRGKTNTAVWE